MAKSTLAKSCAVNGAKGRAALKAAREAASSDAIATAASATSASPVRTGRLLLSDVCEDLSYESIEATQLDDDVLTLAPTPPSSPARTSRQARSPAPAPANDTTTAAAPSEAPTLEEQKRPPTLEETVQLYRKRVAAMMPKPVASVSPVRSQEDAYYEEAADEVAVGRISGDALEWLENARSRLILLGDGIRRTGEASRHDARMVDVTSNSLSGRDQAIRHIYDSYAVSGAHMWTTRHRKWCARILLADADAAAVLVDTYKLYSADNGEYLATFSSPPSSSMITKAEWRATRVELTGFLPNYEGRLILMMSIFNTEGALQSDASGSLSIRMKTIEEAHLLYQCLHRLPLFGGILNVEPK